jgi:biopolymer transport protein TolQ
VGNTSVFSLLGQSGPVVTAVLLMLVGFSVITWTIIVQKYASFKNSSRHTGKFLEVFWGSRSLDTIFAESKKYGSSPISKLFQSGYAELQKIVEFEKYKKDRKDKGSMATTTVQTSSTPISSSDWKFELSGLDNVMRALNRAQNAESTRFERRIPFLATTGSTAPFIGLFGTVWGIMNAFQGIGTKGSASLAVVAPGIAEALIATAVGLAAAIPAVMGYNFFLSRMKVMRTEMDNFCSDFLNIIKRNFFAD